jgi:hypothetical protein
MKTAYELAMERLNKTSPAIKLSDAQKQELAELDSRYAARIAEREIALQAELDRAAGSGDVEKAEQLREQLARERKTLLAELEQKKEQVRQGKR